ncbi:hypothetical protein JIN85_10845 [Luteolibacter pohnpeiensis]|uniref:Uncharacterized protein n=2 Tax=Luteolibacter pohnpeiensis TaxID=454153 RepID=A0A934S8R0_9BACT|nr:hypothetical protein [Luteolibacter pohnpeiensis]
MGLGFWLTSCKPTPPLQAGQTYLPISHADVRLIGRWSQSDQTPPEASWPGFAVAVEFTGRDLSICLRDEGNYYNVSVDGQQTAVVGGKKGKMVVYPLASGLDGKPHRIRFERRNISFDKPTALLGFVLNEGAKLDKAPERARIEFIGDSYTVAEGNESTRETLPWLEKYPVTNFRRGFASMVADALDADAIGICRSGSGVARNWLGDAKNSMLDRYDWTQMETADGGRWAFSESPPILVVICLGINDYAGLKNKQGIVNEASSAEFRDKYHQLIAKVRSHDPDVPILALAPHVEWARENTQLVVSEEAAGHRGGVYYAQFDRFPGGYVSDGHPTVATHRKIADQILAAIRKDRILPLPAAIGEP